MKNSAENWYSNKLDQFINQLLNQNIKLDIKYETQSVNKNPVLCVKHNKEIIYHESMNDGIYQINFDLEGIRHEQCIEISMLGKQPTDTLVHGEKIIKDTFIKILELKINNYSLLTDYDFFRSFFTYYFINEKIKTQPMNGFWQDAVLVIEFTNPFDQWYNTRSKKNTTIAESLKHRSNENLDLLLKNLESAMKKLV